MGAADRAGAVTFQGCLSANEANAPVNNRSVNRPPDPLVKYIAGHLERFTVAICSFKKS